MPPGRRSLQGRIHTPNGGWGGQRVRGGKQVITRVHILVKQLLGHHTYTNIVNDL